MKTYLRLSGNTYDTMLGGLITACRQYLERTTGRLFLSQTVAVQFLYFGNILDLPVTPVQSITSVAYKIAGQAATLPSGDYALDSYGLFPKIVPAYGVSWPAADAESVIVTLSGGATVADKLGIVLVADLFEHPESNVELTLQENKVVSRLFNAWRTR
jgi:uncharacterized phiE125 gp8 family phage protein